MSPFSPPRHALVLGLLAAMSLRGFAVTSLSE